MADCWPPASESLNEDGEEENECGDTLPSGDEGSGSSSSVVASSSTTMAGTASSSQKMGLVERNLEAAKKLQFMRKNKEKHSQKLREKLPPLDEMKVKR